jgi:hypothetical protein
MTTTQPADTARGCGGATKIDSGDTAWLLMSSALVLLMTAPGLALFYGGMVRQKMPWRRLCRLYHHGADFGTVGAWG